MAHQRVMEVFTVGQKNQKVVYVDSKPVDEESWHLFRDRLLAEGWKFIGSPTCYNDVFLLYCLVKE